MEPYIRIFENVLDDDACAAIRNAFDADPAVREDPQPDYSQRLFLVASEHASWLSRLSPLVTATEEVATEYFTMPGDPESLVVPEWIDDGFVIARYDVGHDLALHADGQTPVYPQNGLRLATLLFFLNDCEGGELYFPIQDLKISPRQGRAVMFPPDHWYPHQVLAARSPRYIAQTWLMDPTLMVVEADTDDQD